MVGGEFLTLGGEPGGGDDEGGLWLPGGVGLVGSAAVTLPPSSPPQAASRTQAPTTSESLAPDTHIPILMTPMYAVPRQFSRPAVRGFRGRSAGIQHEPVCHALWPHGGTRAGSPAVSGQCPKTGGFASPPHGGFALFSTCAARRWTRCARGNLLEERTSTNVSRKGDKSCPARGARHASCSACAGCPGRACRQAVPSPNPSVMGTIRAELAVATPIGLPHPQRFGAEIELRRPKPLEYEYFVYKRFLCRRERRAQSRPRRRAVGSTRRKY